jgi:hypothetical protein
VSSSVTSSARSSVLSAARRARDKKDLDNLQKLFRGLAYDPDSMWTRNSRALAKTTCEGLFLLFLMCGTIRLGAVRGAVRVGNQPPPVKSEHGVRGGVGSLHLRVINRHHVEGPRSEAQP